MANPVTVIFGSTQFIFMQITATVVGVQFDPTSDPVSVAIAPPGQPPVTFNTAAWLSGAPVPTVRFLVGPANGGLVLQPGDYDVYVKVTNNPEVPIIACGRLRVLAASG